MRHDYFDDLLAPAAPAAHPPKRLQRKQRYDKPAPAAPAVPANKSDQLHDDAPLAAKLRAAGCPIALEIDGEMFCYLVADDEAAKQADLPGVFYTAAEAEVLAKFDTNGIHELHRLKKTLSGTISQDEVDL